MVKTLGELQSSHSYRMSQKIELRAVVPPERINMLWINHPVIREEFTVHSNKASLI